jgi:cytosine deaminase
MSVESKVKRIREELESLRTNMDSRLDDYPDEQISLLACEEALHAAIEGNYGVGCVLLGPSGDIVLKGHNQVFYPYFRSDLHAEMVVMNIFEDSYQELTDMSGYVLHCTLEPCPMCLARLIASRIGTVKYITPDADGGMIHQADQIPKNFLRLAKNQSFIQSKSSPDIQRLAFEIFLVNINELRGKLFERLPV